MKPAVAFRKAAQIIEDDECVGCCVALIRVTGSVHTALRLIQSPFADLLGYYTDDHTCYWWPVNGSEHESVTPRVIALELAALLSEESPARLSKSPKP